MMHISNHMLCTLFIVHLFSTVTYSAELDSGVLERIETLEREGLQLRRIVKEQKDELDNFRVALQNQNKIIIKQQGLLNDLHNSKKHQGSQQTSDQLTDNDNRFIHVLNDSNDEGNVRNDVQTSASHSGVFNNTPVSERQIHSQDNRPRRLIDNMTPVAFHAVIVKNYDQSTGLHQNIVFDVVKLDLGNNYHKLHGLFIAPIAGLYMFSTSVCTHKAGPPGLFASIVKNGEPIASVLAHVSTASDQFDQSSVSAVIQLTAGDEVWVDHSQSFSSTETVYGDKLSSFMGYLISPM